MALESVSAESREVSVELAGPTPRRVRMTATGWWNLVAAMLFFGLGIAGAAALVKSVIHDAATQSALQQHGSETSGQITEMWTSRDVQHIGYTFSVDGTIYTGKSTVPDNIRSNLHQNDSLPIRYIPANPNINHPAGWEDSPYSTLPILWLPIFVAFFGLMFVRRFPLQRRLAIEGIAVRGTIEKSEWNGPSKGQRYATYTFRNASTDEVEIGSCPSDYFYNKELAVWVLYLANNPKRSEVYPFPIDFFRIMQ